MAGPEGKPVSGSRNGLGRVLGHSHPCAVGWPLRAGPPVSSGGVWCLVAQVQAHMSDGCVCAETRVYCP